MNNCEWKHVLAYELSRWTSTCMRKNICNTIKVLNSQVAIARRHTFSGPGELLVIEVEAHPTKSH